MKRFTLCLALLALAAFSTAQGAPPPPVSYGVIATPITPTHLNLIASNPYAPEYELLWDRINWVESNTINGWHDTDQGFSGPPNSVFAAMLSLGSRTAVSQPDGGQPTVSKQANVSATFEARWSVEEWVQGSNYACATLAETFASRLDNTVTGTLNVSQIQSMTFKVYYIVQDSLSVNLSATAHTESGDSLSTASGTASAIHSLSHSIPGMPTPAWYQNTGWKDDQDDTHHAFNFDQLPSSDSHVRTKTIVLFAQGPTPDGKYHWVTSVPLTILSDTLNASSAATDAPDPSWAGGTTNLGGDFQARYLRTAFSEAYAKEWIRVFAQRCIAFNRKVTKGKYAYSDGAYYVPGTTITIRDASNNVVFQAEGQDLPNTDMVMPIDDTQATGLYNVTVSAPGYDTATTTVFLSGTAPIDFGTLTIHPAVN